MAESNGSSFDTSAWEGWSSAAWDALRRGDFNGDGLTDVVGLLDGAWFVGTATTSSFTTSLWSQWTHVDWENVLVADLNRDGNDDILARVGGNWWASLSNGTTFNAPTLWASWAEVSWDEFAIGTAGSGVPTLFGFIDGEWWSAQVASSNDGFVIASKRATLPNADYDAITLFDDDGDHDSDFAVLVDGIWTIGTQSGVGGSFDELQTVQWADTDWQDVRIGDFDGDGRDDILARAAGEWWVMRFENDAFVTTCWDAWANVDWQDVTIGDFNGDGTDDLAGRYAGQWWVGVSNGIAFVTSLWDTWTEGGWDAVLAGDVNGVATSTASNVVLAGKVRSEGATSVGPGSIRDDLPSDPEICEDYPYLNDVGALPSSDDDPLAPEICEDFPFLDDDSIAPADETNVPEICLDYPFLDDDALLDELLTTA